MLFGTAAGQAISVLLSPVLTRLYSPDEFGYLSLYSSLMMVLGGVAWAVWVKKSPRTEAIYNMPVASGFIAGEALVVLVIAVIAAVRSLAQ